MDVLIKGMKIPKSCEECWMTYEGDSDNCPVVNESVAKYMVEEKKHPACPLIKVPPHGDLKDANKILQWLNRICDERQSVSVGEIIDYIENAPTVLEATE